MIQRFMEYEPQLHAESWVHPDATIIGQVTLAAGATVWPRAVLRGDMGLISIGEDTNIQDGAVAHVTLLPVPGMPGLGCAPDSLGRMATPAQ